MRPPCEVGFADGPLLEGMQVLGAPPLTLSRLCLAEAVGGTTVTVAGGEGDEVADTLVTR